MKQLSCNRSTWEDKFTYMVMLSIELKRSNIMNRRNITWLDYLSCEFIFPGVWTPHRRAFWKRGCTCGESGIIPQQSRSFILPAMVVTTCMTILCVLSMVARKCHLYNILWLCRAFVTKLSWYYSWSIYFDKSEKNVYVIWCREGL